MDYKRDLEELSRLLSELKEDGRVKVVEGERDKKALEYFGITNIKMIHGSSLAKLAGSVKGDVILLTDFDRTGGMLTKRLCELFKNESIHVDLDYRREIRRYSKINEIEELVAKYNKLEDKTKGD